MPAKKLQVELEVDTSKAKQKVKRDLEGDSSSPSTSTSPSPSTSTSTSTDKLARSLERASKGADSLADSTRLSGQQLRGMVKGFAGMGIGLAMSYAAGNMERSNSRTAVETAGGMISGGSAGAMMGGIAGPLGAALGAALGGTLGGLKVLLEKNAESKAFSQDYLKSEATYYEQRDWAQRLKDLSKVEKIDPSLTGNKALEAELKALEKPLENLETALKQLADGEKQRKIEISNAIANNDLDRASALREELSFNRTKIAAAESARESLLGRQESLTDRLAAPSTPAAVATYGASDALSKIGGMTFGLSHGTAEMKDPVCAALLEKTNDLLQEIANSDFGSTWQ